MLRDARVMAILPAVDIERAKTFYTEKLGLQLADGPTVGGDAAFEGSDGTLLYLYEREARTKAEHTAAGWMVSDIEKVVDQLRKKGVEFEQYDLPSLKTDERGIAELAGSKTAWFKDTEGNILAINEFDA